MPIYEYEVEGSGCEICGGRFELRRPADREPLTSCPLCQKPVRKVISASHSPRHAKTPSLDDAKRAGFTVLERRDQGLYEKK